MTATLVGFVFIALGVWGTVHWFPEFVHTLKGIGPISLVVGGVVALLAGLSSLTASASTDDSKD